MKKKTFGLILVAVLIAIATATFVKDNVEKKAAEIPESSLGSDVEFLPTEEGLEKGKSAPDFEVTSLTGETVKLSDYKGKKVILNFWASWCPPCKAEMPHMQNFYEDYAEEENVEILAVNLTTEDHGLDKVEQFVADYGLTFPIPLDEDGKLLDIYQTITIPTTYMLDTNGVIQNKIVGPMDEQMMMDFVKSLE